MARAKGEFALEFGGEKYTLVFDWDAIALFEDATDLSIFEVFGVVGQASAGGKPPKLSLLGSLLQAGLARHHPQITRAQAMEMVINPEAQAALTGAFEIAVPATDAGEAGEADDDDGAPAPLPAGRAG